MALQENGNVMVSPGVKNTMNVFLDPTVQNPAYPLLAGILIVNQGFMFEIGASWTLDGKTCPNYAIDAQGP